jgi:hypothetical protein
MQKYLEMLRYGRPEGSATQKMFCNKYLKPVFGRPDGDGNYHIEVGKSNLIFTSHHDTVHHKEGLFNPIVDKNDIVHADPSASCLGADCTTGVWLMLEMIKAGISGLYVVHSGEEVGCLGSQAYTYNQNDYLVANKSICISFDRMGTNSVITHQLGGRTCSEAFAASFIDALAPLRYEPDSTGVYTDSNEYAHIIPECTNLSVGYYSQHTAKEIQDLRFLTSLRDQLITMDWTNLRVEREPSHYDYTDFDYAEEYYSSKPVVTDNRMLRLVKQYPEDIVVLLESYGFDYNDLYDELMKGAYQ